MATSVGSVHNSSDLVKDYACSACESKTIEEIADYMCATCMKFFCGKCVCKHDELYANHSKYGRGEINKWPLTKTMEDFLLKCDVHKENKLNNFCQNHSQLCCTDCVLLNHRQCSNVTPISDSVEKMSVDMQQSSINLQTIVDELNKFKSTQEASIQFVEVSYSENLGKIQNLRKKFNSALDALEKTTLNELDKMRTTLQTSLRKDVENCSRLKDQLKQLSEAVNVLCDKSKNEIEFIVSRKCLDKIQECKTYLKESPVRVQSSIIFKANIDIEQYLSQHSSLGRIEDSMQSLTLKMNPDLVLNVKRTSEYIVSIPSYRDMGKTNSISGICCLPSGQIIVTDCSNEQVKLFNQHYNMTSHCYVSGSPSDICQITSSEVAVTVNKDVQFIYLNSYGQLENGRMFRLPHYACGIALHQGALYVTSCTALYRYTLNGDHVKTLYEDAAGPLTVFHCAVSPAGDRIYVTNHTKNKLITLATDGSLISTFTDYELKGTWGVHVTPAGQVLVCAFSSQVIQVDHDGRKKLATLISLKDRVSFTGSVFYNTITDQIIVGLYGSNKIIVLELQ